MAAITGDGVTVGTSEWILNYGSKTLAKNASYMPTTRHTVNELYSWLMALFSNAAEMDDTIPIQANTPTEYQLINGWTFNNDISDTQYLYGGSIIVVKAGGNDIWANFYTLGSIAADAVVYWQQGVSAVPTYSGYTLGHIDQLIKTTASGSAVNSQNITAYIRNLGETYDFFQVQATATGGRNPVPLATATDLNDSPATSAGTYPGMSITFNSVTQDIGDGNGPQPYDVTVNASGYTCAQAYKYLKYITSSTISGNVGTNSTVAGKFYQTATVTGSYSPVKAAPFGSFAGGKFFGARGVWLAGVTDTMNMQLIDSNNIVRNPPTTISVLVTGVVSGDRVLVARTASGAVNKNQFTILSTSASAIGITTAVPADIPNTGTIRVGDTPFTYTSKTASGFSGVSPTPAGQTGGMYVPLIDAMATTTTISSPAMTYLADFSVIARVRVKGILPFENTGTVGNTGLSISAIRTTDTIVV